MIRGSVRKAPDKAFNVSTSIHNRFDIEVLDASTGEIKQRAFAENVICDQLWEKLCSSGTYNYAIQYGDGQGTPSPSDTSLFSFLGYIASSVYRLHYDYDNNVFTCTTKAVLNESTAVGKTLTEVGISHSSTATSLVTHAMLKDMNGNPVSLEKSDTDIFNIYATIYAHFSFPSDSVRWVEGYRRDGAYYTSGVLQHIVGLSSMPALYCGRVINRMNGRGYVAATNAYDVPNRSIVISAKRLAVGTYNQGGLCSISLTAKGDRKGGYPVVICDVDESDGWYSKTTIQGESIGTGDGETKDFATKFGPAKSVTVYVDGAPVQCSTDSHNHTVYTNLGSFPCLSNPLLSYFKLLRHPEIGYGYYNSDYYLAAVAIASSGEDYASSGYLTSRLTDYPAVYENTVCDEFGVYQIYQRTVTVKASNDLKTWVSICNSGGSYTTTTVPKEYRHYRYWSIQSHASGPGYGSYYYGAFYFESTDDEKLRSINNLHLVEPPPAGSVITADYDAICVGKDSNHVFDFSITLKFGEYTESQ